MKNIHDHVGIAVSQNNMRADRHSFTIRRRGGQTAIQVDGNRVDLALLFRRKCFANHELPFQARG